MINTKTKYIPSGYLNCTRNDFGEVHYMTTPKCVAIAYRGKCTNKSFHYSFATIEKMEAYISKWLSDLATCMLAVNQQKEDKRAKEKALKASDYYKIGDILDCSWGYDQTNVDFYQVLEVGNKTIKIRKIGGESFSNDGGSSMSCKVSAVKDSFIEKEPVLTKKVKLGGSVCMSSYSWASKWDGQQKYCSWYA